MLLARDDQPMRSGFHAGSLVNTTAPSRVGVATDPGVNIQDLGKSCIGGCLLQNDPAPARRARFPSTTVTPEALRTRLVVQNPYQISYCGHTAISRT